MGYQTTDAASREIGPDGTITLFQDLLRHLDARGTSIHIDAPVSGDRGEVSCRAVLYTAGHQYAMTAIQPAPDDDNGSRLWCIVSQRTMPAMRNPLGLGQSSRNILGRTGDPLTAETFREILREIVVNEMVDLDTAPGLGDHDEELPAAMEGVGIVGRPTGPTTQRDEDAKEIIARLERWSVPGALIGEVVQAILRPGR